jgi:hypothetical protein
MGLLSVAIWLPIIAGALLLALGRDEQAGIVRWTALLAALAAFLVTIPLITGFDTTTAAMQFQENLPWISRFNVRYHLGVDGISLWFVLLTAFITVIVVIAGWEVITERVQPVHGCLPAAVRAARGRVQRRRRSAVLCVLRGHADSDVHHHRRVGWTQPRVCGLQVLPLHAAGLAADAGGAGLPVHPVRRQLRHTGLAQAAAARTCAGAAVLRLLRRLLGQGADVAGAHLAARRTRRGTHWRLGGAGSHHAEAGRLRLSALFDADHCPMPAANGRPSSSP